MKRKSDGVIKGGRWLIRSNWWLINHDYFFLIILVTFFWNQHHCRMKINTFFDYFFCHFRHSKSIFILSFLSKFSFKTPPKGGPGADISKKNIYFWFWLITLKSHKNFEIFLSRFQFFIFLAYLAQKFSPTTRKGRLWRRNTI